MDSYRKFNIIWWRLRFTRNVYRYWTNCGHKCHKTENILKSTAVVQFSNETCDIPYYHKYYHCIGYSMGIALDIEKYDKYNHYSSIPLVTKYLLISIPMYINHSNQIIFNQQDHQHPSTIPTVHPRSSNDLCILPLCILNSTLQRVDLESHW